jgi:predicted PurR-regulated permease PerM
VTTAAFNQLQRFFYVLGTMVLVVLSLYFARLVLLPLVAAILLTFILSPLTNLLQSKGCPRIPAIILVVGVVFIFLVLIFAMIVGEFNHLAGDIPQYKSLIRAKIDTIRDVSDGSFAKSLLDLFQEVSQDLTQAPPETPDTRTGPIPVTVESSFLPVVQSILGSVLDFLVNAGLVMLLAIFMLHQREELRNRFVSLLGYGNLSGTIKIIDDASQRISRFLEMQLLVNLAFGACIGGGLFLIGVPYAYLWGFLGALLRYVPYLGPWLAASFPLLLAWSIFPTWTPFCLALGLFMMVELTLSNFVEPWLYGRSVGVSEVALLLFAVFWGWLWGPMGLILATPLTAVLVVFGRHFPQLEFFTVLLSDQPALDPHLAFFHRLLANDQDEATEISERYLKEHGLEAVYTDIFISSLTSLDKEREQGQLTAEEQKRIVQSCQEILDDAIFPQHQAHWAQQNRQREMETSKVLVVGVPTRPEDELVLEMFKECLDPRKFKAHILSGDMLLAEMLETIKAEKPAFVVIGCLPSTRSSRGRFLCKKIHQEAPDEKLLVGCWGWESVTDQIIQRFKGAGADYVGTTFSDVGHQLEVHHPIVTSASNGKEVLV